MVTVEGGFSGRYSVLGEGSISGGAKKTVGKYAVAHDAEVIKKERKR